MKKRIKVVGAVLATLVIGGFCWRLLTQTRYDPTVVSTIVTGVVAVLVGLAAAYIGARTTLQATKEAHRNNLELQKQTHDAVLQGVVQAIYAELSCLWEMYEAEFGDELKKLQPGEEFSSYFPLTQEYFTIYNSNSVFIGQLTNPELRRSIVRAYLKVKALIDSHLLNNKFIDEHDRLTYAQSLDSDPVQVALVGQALSEWQEYGEAVQSTYMKTKKAVTTALQLIEESGMLQSTPTAVTKISSGLDKPPS